jgi:ABC-type Zn uptake system ZnuABC Zn-binding protein ZnuA
MKTEDIEDALTDALYHALIEKDPDKRETFTKIAIAIADQLKDDQVDRSKDFALYRAKSHRLPR